MTRPVRRENNSRAWTRSGTRRGTSHEMAMVMNLSRTSILVRPMTLLRMRVPDGL